MEKETDDFFGDGSSADEGPPDNRSGARQIALKALYAQISNEDSAKDQVKILWHFEFLSKLDFFQE